MSEEPDDLLLPANSDSEYQGPPRLNREQRLINRFHQ